MENHPAAQQASSQLSLASRAGWAILIVATLYVCYFSHLGAIGFVGPDEPRYAWIARDMAETGDWVTPRLYGKPWFEKPPLFYWEAALSFKLFGVSEAAARLPSAISALLATLALGWLTWSMYGAETARWLLLLLPTTVGMIGFSHAAATDMPFSAMLTIAMVFAAILLGLAPSSDQSRSLPSFTSSTSFTSVFFGFFLGLAVLAKGPVGLVLCGGAVFFWALFTKRWRDAFRLLHPGAIVAFCAMSLPWYILCARRNPDFFRIFIIEHNFKRYLTPEFQHIQPFWFYVPILLVVLLPWTILMLWSGTIGVLRVWHDRELSTMGVYFASWALFCLGFFSISQSKLPGYILPAIPAICVGMSRSCATLASSRLQWFRIAQLSAAFVLLGVCLILEMFTRTAHQGSEQFAAAAGLVIGCVGAANLILAICLTRGPADFRNLAAGFSVLPVLSALLLSGFLLPSFFFWDPSGRSIARELHNRGIPSEKVYVKQMSRGQHYSLDFYLNQEVPDWDSNHPAKGYILMVGKHCNAPANWNCEEVPFDLNSTGRFLYRVGPMNSAGDSGGGQPH